MAKKVDPLAKAIHDLCVAAGAKWPPPPDPGARKAANTVLKRTAQTFLPGPRRRTLTVAEAERHVLRMDAR